MCLSHFFSPFLFSSFFPLLYQAHASRLNELANNPACNEISQPNKRENKNNDGKGRNQDRKPLIVEISKEPIRSTEEKVIMKNIAEGMSQEGESQGEEKENYSHRINDKSQMNVLEIMTANEEKKDRSDDNTEIVLCVLGILSAMLALGSVNRSDKEEKALNSLLLSLHVIAYRESDTDLSQAASEAAMLLLTRHCAKSKSISNGNQTENNNSSQSIDVTPNYKKNPLIEAIQSTSHNHGIITDRNLFPSSDDKYNNAAVEMNVTESKNVKNIPSNLPISPFCQILFKTLNDYCSCSEAYMRAMGVHTISLAIKDLNLEKVRYPSIQLILSHY